MIALAGSLSPRQDGEMSSEETDTSDSKEPDVDQSPSTDSELPTQSNIKITSGRTGDKKSSKVLTSSHRQAADAIFPNVKQTTLSAYTPSTAFKNPPLSNTYDANAMNSDDSSAGFPATDEDPSAAASTDPRGDTLGKRLFSNNPADCYSDHVLYDDTAICDFCMADSNSICRNCLLPVCEKCVRIYNTDLCSATKGQHNFVELNKTSQPMSADFEALSNQPGATVNRETGGDDKEWKCSRCTFLNSPEHGICAMCASSRGLILWIKQRLGAESAESARFTTKQAQRCVYNAARLWA